MTKIPDAETKQAEHTREMTIPNQYDNIDWGAKSRLVNRKVSHKDTNTGTVYGSKVIMTKEATSFKSFLITEDEDITKLPDSVIAEIRKNINAGAKDLQQNWKDALELVNKAYQVASIRRPIPNEKGAWKQYEEMIRHAVRKLSEYRGLNGPWRSSTVLIRESVSKHRFFVHMPGENAVEVEAESMDAIIDQLSNKVRRNGAKLRVEQRDKTTATLALYIGDDVRDRVKIVDVS